MRLSKQDIQALAAFASTDETRPHLCCIYFEPEDGRAVATDGHTLVIRQDVSREPGAAPFLVRAKDLLAAAKALAKDEGVNVAPGSLTTTGAAFPIREIHATFPPYRDVIKRPEGKKRATSFGIDVFYLSRLEKVAKAAGSRVRGALIEPGETDLDPVHFTITGPESTWSGVIVPRRV
jgi:hypothetical protein